MAITMIKMIVMVTMVILLIMTRLMTMIKTMKMIRFMIIMTITIKITIIMKMTMMMTMTMTVTTTTTTTTTATTTTTTTTMMMMMMVMMITIITIITIIPCTWLRASWADASKARNKKAGYSTDRGGYTGYVSSWARGRHFTYRYHLWWQRLVIIFRIGRVSGIYFDMIALSGWQLKIVMSSFIHTPNETRSYWWTSLSLQEILRKRQCMSYI